MRESLLVVSSPSEPLLQRPTPPDMRNPCDICEAFDERFGRVAPEVIALSHEEQLLFSAVDALLEQIAQDPLPPPAERKRLREA
ncbi:hypothetical protein GTV15_03405, partial [Streptomyces sp. SID7803]|nr:hypothetical protein [Streptomyces sp. SID7803]